MSVTISTRTVINNLPKVNYETALVHFQRFLDGKFNGGYTVESILKLILDKQIDV